jgi:hypothetical protein
MNIPIPARYSSLKTLFKVIRETDKITSHTDKSISGRSKLFGDGGSWYYSIGGNNLPSTLVKTNTEAAAELCKALHAFGAQSHTSLIISAIWTAVQDGTYLIAQYLESQPHKSKLSESGINTLSTNTYLIGQHIVTNENHAIHTFAHYDGILVISGGLASVQLQYRPIQQMKVYRIPVDSAARQSGHEFDFQWNLSGFSSSRDMKGKTWIAAV